MRTIITLALAALLVAVLALPAAAASGIPVPSSCSSPQAYVTCVPSQNQGNNLPSGMNIPVDSGVIKMTCTMHLEGQELGISWAWNPQVTGQGQGIKFPADCSTPYSGN